MPWTIETLDERVDAELAALPVDMRASFIRIAELIAANGPQHVGQPHVKSLGDKLFEMRMRGRDGIARAIYVTAKGQRVVVVLVFVKKSQATPPAVLKLARKRAEEVT